jgi:hypothetical protein
MSTTVIQRPASDGDREAVETLERQARAARLILQTAYFLPPVLQGDDVLVYFVSRGGPPGKRYRHAPGWIAQFQRDLLDAQFLTI